VNEFPKQLPCSSLFPPQERPAFSELEMPNQKNQAGDFWDSLLIGLGGVRFYLFAKSQLPSIRGGVVSRSAIADSSRISVCEPGETEPFLSGAEHASGAEGANLHMPRRRR